MSNPFADGPGTDRPDAESQGVDVVAVIRGALRGRWILAIVAGLVLAIPAALVGYNSASIEYAASVSVEVLNTPDSTLYDDFARSENERIFQYMQRQESEIRGQRILERAVNHPALQAIGWPTNNDGQSALRQSIRVEYRNLSANFTVRTIHEDPDTANAAIRALVETYGDLKRERNSPEELERQLETEIRQLDAQIAQYTDSIEAATAEFGTTDLKPLISESQADRRAAEKQLALLEDRVAVMQENEANGDEIDPDQLDVADLAQFDNELARLVDQRERLQTELDIQSENFGSRHPAIESLRQEIAGIDRRLDTRVALVRNRLFEEGFGNVVPGAFTLEELEINIRRTRSRIADIAAELSRLNQVSKAIQRDQNELNLAQLTREDLSRRLTRLDIERENIQRGRINIAPIAPATVYDDKRKPFAMAGFVFGGGAGVGLVIAYGLYRKTFRYVDDVDDPARLPPLLGTLPELDRKDPDAERIAAVSVHNLRNTLHSISRAGEADSQVIVCTSAEPADGKTTLIQSLGASYALTGLRTIIVDLDLVGGGLTARLGMSGRRGVADLLGGLEPTKCIKRTATEKLYALPAGDVTACKPEQLAHRPVQQVIDWLRERFDVVLLDTGPVLGSLEAGLAVGFADQALLVVPRGQTERVARAAITRLRRLGADNIGLVFNRADTTDLKQSLSAASIGAPSLRQTQRRIHERRLDQDASIVGSIPPPETGHAPRRAAEDGTGL